MRNDGEVIIGAKLDTKQLEKDIKNEYKELEKFKKEAEKLSQSKIKIEAEVELKGKEYDRKVKEIQEKARIDINAITSTGSSARAREKKIIETEQLKINQLTEQYNQYLQNTDNKLADIEAKQKSNATQQELITSKIGEMNTKLKGAKGYEAINNSISKIGNGLSGIIKKVAKWSLAIVGVRSIYLGIRSAMSTLGQYDDTITNRVDYLKWVLANTLKPIIEWIIKALYSIVGLVGKVISFITGKNIFEHSGIKDYEKALKNSNKNAKDLKKTLTGFDEMNVLNDDGSVGVAGKLAGIDTDLSKENEGVFEGIGKAVANASNAIQDYRKSVHEALNNKEIFDEEYGNWSYFMQGLVTQSAGVLDFLSGLGEIVGGVVGFIVGLVTQNGEVISESINTLISGLIDTISGIFEFIVGILQMLLGIVVGIALDVFDGIVSILSPLGKWVYDNVIKPIGDFFAGLWNKLVEGAVVAWETIKSIFGAVAGFFKTIFTNAWEGVKAVFSTGGKIFTGIKEGILEGFKRIVNVIIDGINKVVAIPFNGINKAFDGLRSVDLWGWKPFEWVPKFNVPQLPKLAKGGIINNPGPGVAIGGEVSREGVIPLTDSQQMSLLGQEIGKYINLKATIPVYVGNRQIAREVRRIDAEDNFAFNG